MIIDGEEFSYLIHKPRERAVPRRRKAGMPREQVISTPQKSEFIGPPPRLATGQQVGGRPFAILFSTRRALATEREPSKGAAAGGVRAALAEAYVNRSFRLSEFAEWIRVQRVLSDEDKTAKRRLSALQRSIGRFLPDYKNLHESSGKIPRLLINRAGITLDVQTLSDGE